MSKAIQVLAFLIGICAVVNSQYVCNSRQYTYDSFVCVCDSTTCNFPGPVPMPVGFNYSRIVTSRDQYRFELFEGVEEPTATGSTLIIVEHFLPEKQAIMGFGSSFTDSAGLNINSLSSGMQELLLRSYFGGDGNDYNLCRVPIAGSDFSTYAYSYDDVWMDVDLSEWSLVWEDVNVKIPYMLRAANLSDQEVLILGSPWSPPAWMKTNGMHNGSGELLPEMWDPYSEYLIKFIQAYEAEGVPIWGLTPQNEPPTGFTDWAWNTCGWNATYMRDWIKGSFGPALTAAGYGEKKLLGYDFNRGDIPEYPAVALEDPDSAQYIDGTAVHWYDDMNIGPERLDWLHGNFTDKFILYTEACDAFYGDIDDRVHLGDWSRADRYAHDIIENLNHWSTGWIDWNMALSTTGGPNWAYNFVDSPIIVNATADEFLKQPHYYAMGHFSRFIARNAVVIETVVSGSPSIEAVALHNPNGEEVVVLVNRGETTESVSIETHRGEFVNFDMNPMSIETVFYEG